jgi:hypothetical protein
MKQHLACIASKELFSTLAKDEKFIPFLTLFLQVIIAYIVLSGIYIVYAITDFDYDGIISGITFLIFQPLLGFFLISITVLLCLILGLPTRLERKV